MVRRLPAPEASRTWTEAAQVIEDSRHPVVRRVADVMRSGATRPRTLLIEDEDNIAQAIAAGVQIDSLYVTPGFHMTGEFEARTVGLPLYRVSESVAKVLFKGDKRFRLFALVRAPKPPTLRDMSGRGGDVVVLDGVRIAGNIGAIVRSACAFGAAGIVLLDSLLANVFDRRVIRASRGLAFSIPIVLATPDELARFLRAEGIPLVSLDADGDVPLRAIGSESERVALLMGSERTGASMALEGLANWRCAVPMRDGVESLNVSVATGIALYERRRLALPTKS